ncbi:MAG: glycosyltransferase [Pirellulales bacterium]|nr:glycosyltransferase [Pirellulales bacterium]
MTSGRLPAQPPNEVIFCVVANCARVKGIDVFLRAFKRILENYPQCSCVQVGIDVNKNPQYKVLARELGVAHKVQWVGITDHAYDHIRACDIFVQPSRREAFGFTLLEAMYAGKPIVATRVGGIPEAVADGVNGRLVASDDHVELAEACISLIGNPSERERLGANGRARVVEKFDSRVMIRKLLREYYGLRHPQIAERDRAL